MLKKIKVVKPFANLAKKTKKAGINFKELDDHHGRHDDDEYSHRRSLLVKGTESSPVKTPTGFFAVYVGEGRERFLVPTSFLSHPLFKILLEKVHDEFGFEQKNGLVVPCSVSTFQEVVSAVESNHGRFDMRKLFEEFV